MQLSLFPSGDPTHPISLGISCCTAAVGNKVIGLCNGDIWNLAMIAVVGDECRETRSWESCAMPK